MNSTKKWISVFILAAAMILILSAGTMAAEKLNKKTLSLMEGTSETLSVNTKKRVTWKSANKSVAAVKNGKVTGKKAGKTTISATVKGSKKVLKCTVTVTAKSAPAAPKSAASSNTLSGNFSQLTPEEQRVLKVLLSYRSDYPEGMPYDNSVYYMWNGGIYMGGYGCAAFAFLLSDAAFGETPAVKHTDFDNIRVGDIVRLNYNTHSVIVLQNRGTSLVVAEGNYNKSIHWGRVIPMDEVKKTGTHVMTRYASLAE